MFHISFGTKIGIYTDFIKFGLNEFNLVTDYLVNDYSLFTRKSNACSSEFRQISICMYTIHIMTATGINHSGFVVPCSIRKQWHTKEVALPKRVVFGQMKKVSKGMV